MSSREEFVHRVRSGGFYSVLVLLCIFPVMGVSSLLESSYGKLPGTVGVLLVLALAAMFYAFFVTDVKLAFDGATVRFSLLHINFGLRRAHEVQWELPIAELASVHEVTTRTPSSRGGWVHSTVLHFPGDRKLTDGSLGSKSVPTSEYNRLIQMLRTRLGDRFTSEEKT